MMEDICSITVWPCFLHVCISLLVTGTNESTLHWCFTDFEVTKSVVLVDVFTFNGIIACTLRKDCVLDLASFTCTLNHLKYIWIFDPP